MYNAGINIAFDSIFITVRTIFLDVSTIITGKFLSIIDCSENNFSSIGFSRFDFFFQLNSVSFGT